MNNTVNQIVASINDMAKKEKTNNLSDDYINDIAKTLEQSAKTAGSPIYNAIQNDYKKEISFETLGTDLGSTAKNVENAFNGWQDADTMKKTKNQVENVYKRLKAYSDYNADYGDGSIDVSEQLKAYKDLLDGWDDLSSNYGKYVSADEYNNSIKQKNLSKEELENALKTAKDLEYDITVAVNGSQYSPNYGDNISKAQKKLNDFLNQYGVKTVKELKQLLSNAETRAVTSENTKSLYQYQIEIDSLEYVITEAEAIDKKRVAAIRQKNSQAEWDALKEMKTLLGNNGYKTIDEARQALSKLKGERNSLRTYKVGSNEYSDELTAITNPETVFYNKNVEDYIKKGENTDKYKQYVFEDNEYRFLTKPEKRTLAYYIAKDEETGKNETEKFLKDLTETLNTREAKDYYKKNLEDNTFLEILYAVPVGLDQFASGVKNLFNTEDDYIPLSSTQIAGQLARSDLEEVKLPEWLGGFSLAGVAYDSLSTISNMVPSILASFVANAIVPGSGAVVGGVLLGGSAAGNAYQEALNNGMDKSQARTYSTLVGVSETLLSTTLSKVMGGKAISGKLETAIDGIENGFIRFAANYGVAFASEGLEEGLQEILTPFFENFALGYQKNGFEDIDWGEVVYSFLLGGLSGGLFETIGTVGGKVINHFANVSETAKSYNTPLKVAELIDLGLKMPKKSKAYKAAEKLDGLTKAGKNISKNQLYNAVVSTENVIADRLAQLGETNNVSAVANAVVKKLTGAELSVNDIEVLSKSSYGQEVLDTIVPQAVETEAQAQENEIAADVEAENTVADTDGEQGLGFTEPTDQEIYRNPTPEENQEAIFGKRKNAKQRHIVDVAKKLDSDIKVVFVPKDSKALNGKNGKFNRNSKTIYIAEDLKTTEMYAEVFKHEFVHRLEIRKAYDSFKNYLFNKSETFGDYAISRLNLKDEAEGKNKVKRTRKQAVDELIDMYVENTKGDLNLTKKEAEREAVADFVARTLFKGNTEDLRLALKSDNGEDFVKLTAMPTDLALFEEMARTDRNLLQKFIDAIKDLIASIKGMPNLEKDLQYIEERLARVYESADMKKTATESGVTIYSSDGNITKEESKQIIKIVNENISKIKDTLLFDEKSVDIRNYEHKSDYVLEIFDSQGNVAINKKLGQVELVRSGAKSTILHGYGKVKIAAIPAIKTVIENGDIISHEPNYTENYDRYIIAGKGIVDGNIVVMGVAVNSYNTNNGVNKFYLHEAKIIEAEPFSMTGLPKGKDTVDDSASKVSISNDIGNVKQKQLDIILESNPAPNTYQTWVRSVDDIHTWDEVLELNDESEGQFVWGDFSREDAEQALKDGTITIYSSYPIENGVFVSTSKIQAQEYAGGRNGKVYSKTVPLDSVAWINGDEGQYAVVENIDNDSYSSDNLDTDYLKAVDAEKMKSAINNEIKEIKAIDPKIKFSYDWEYDKKPISYIVDRWLKDKDSTNPIHQILDELSSKTASEEDWKNLFSEYLFRFSMAYDSTMLGADSETLKTFQIDMGSLWDGYDSRIETNKQHNPQKSEIVEPQKTDFEEPDITSGVFFERRKPSPNTSSFATNEKNNADEVENLKDRVAKLESELKTKKYVPSGADDLTIVQNKLLNRYENGEITREEYQGAIKKYFEDAIAEVQDIEWEKQRELIDRNVKNKKRIKRQNEQLAKDRRELRREAREQVEERDSKQKNIENIRKMVKSLYTKLSTNNASKHIPEQFKKHVAEFLKVFYENDRSPFDRKDFEILELVYNRYINEEAEGVEMGFDTDIQRTLQIFEKTLDGKTLRDLNVHETRMLRQLLDNFSQIINWEDKMRVNGTEYETDQVGKTALNELESTKSKRENVLIKLKDKAIVYANMLPAYFFNKMGGVFKKLYDDIVEAQDKWYRKVENGKTFIMQLKRKYHYSKWEKRTLKLKTEKGDEIQLTVEQAMLLFATAKREYGNEFQKAEHLFRGGIVIPPPKREVKQFVAELKEALKDEKNGEKKSQTIIKSFTKEVDSRAHRITPEDILQIKNWLTDEQIAYVDEFVEYLSTDMAHLGNEISLQLYGIKKYNEDYYVPYVSAPDFLYSQPGVTNEARLKHQSFTKDTTHGANTPLILSDFSTVCADHINRMCMYNAFTIPLENLNKIFNYKIVPGAYSDENQKSVSSEIKRVFGEHAAKFIERFIKDMNGNVRTDNDLNWVMRWVSKFKKGAVLGSLSVAIQQPSAIMRAMAYINPKYFVKTTFKLSERDYQQCIRYSGIAGIKEMGRFDTGTGAGTVDWMLQETPEGFKEKVKAFFGKDSTYRDDKLAFFPAKMDEITWGHIWAAVKAEIADTTDLKVGSEEYFKACGKRFNEVINLTQVYDSTLSRSQLMRSKNELAIMATAFMAEPTVSLNMLMDAADKFNKGGAKEKAFAVRAVAAFVSSVALNSLLKSLVTAARDDDEDKSYLEKYASEVMQNLSEGINPVNMIPFAKDAWSIFKGYTVERVDMSLFSDLAQSLKYLQSDKKSGWEKFESVLGSVAAMFGIPAKNLIRDGKAVYNLYEDLFVDENETTWQGLKFAVTGAEDSDKYAALIEAAEEDDEESYQAIYKELIDSGKDDADIKKAIKTAYGKSEEVQEQTEEYLNKLQKNKTYKSLDNEDKKELESNIKSKLASEKTVKALTKKPDRFDDLYEAYRTNKPKYKRMEKEMLDEGMSESLISDGLEMARIAYMKSKGIDVSEYLLYKIATNHKNADKDKSGGITDLEKTQAIREMDIDEKIKNYFLYQHQ